MSQVTPLNESVVKERIGKELPGWELRDGAVSRTFKTGGWPHTLMVVNAVGYVCEAACHHPDMLVSYAQITVRLSTHEPRGITEKDFATAKKIGEVVLWLPAAGGALEGFEKGFKKPWTK